MIYHNQWPDYTVKTGHHSGHNQLATILRWPDYIVEPVYSGHPLGHNQFAGFCKWAVHLACIIVYKSVH